MDRLHAALRASLPETRARAILVDAGRATGDYLLGHRIPVSAQAALRLSPASLAACLLVRAIRGHAWTFAGSGRFVAQVGRQATFEIGDNPLSVNARSPQPFGDGRAATFERLFQPLVSRRTRVVETDCMAAGAPCCRFRRRWR